MDEFRAETIYEGVINDFGVVAEQENIAIDDRFFALDLPADVGQVFENNRAASLFNHLPAFQRCTRSPATGGLTRSTTLNDHSFTAMSAASARRLAAVKAAPVIDKRDAILRAAIKVFARHGYFQSQVADIARVAGVAAGTVYLYFRSKDDLLVSIFDRTMKDAIDEGRAALADVPDPAERLRRIARLHLERLGRDRDLAVVVQVELRQSIKFMERFSSTHLQDYLNIIRRTIADGQAAGVFRADVNANTAAKVFFGALDEMATNWMLSRRKYALAGDADAVVDLIVGGLGR